MMDDARIIALFFARSEQAIQELDHQYGESCRRLSLNLLNDRQDAEECVNDAYLGAWNAIPPAEPAPLLPYLLKMVRNISLHLYWKKAAAKRGGSCTAALAELEDCIAGRETAETALEARELARMIEGFLDTLTPENRVIFLRRYWFSDSCQDIAGLTGLRETNVSVRLSLIRKRMKQYLMERGVLI